MAPASAHSLPPSVEEAYRRKCALLKQRTADVEETNDAARVRLARLKRQVEKQRIERAFLLEQLAKRTSTNVEDSDGSPSPPPTPKDKPLRTKRGHRKASLTGPGDAGAPPTTATTFISQNVQAQSPGSDAPNNSADGQKSAPAKGKEAETDKDADKAGKANDKAKAKDGSDTAKKPALAAAPRTAYEIYCHEERPALLKKQQQDKGDVVMADAGDDKAADARIDQELMRGWKALADSRRDDYEKRASDAKGEASKTAERPKLNGKDEDTEMADDAAEK